MAQWIKVKINRAAGDGGDARTYLFPFRVDAIQCIERESFCLFVHLDGSGKRIGLYFDNDAEAEAARNAILDEITTPNELTEVSFDLGAMAPESDHQHHDFIPAHRHRPKP